MATISNIFIDQGTTFTTTISVADSNGAALDITGYTGIAQLRKTYESITSVPFNVVFETPTTNGQVTISLTDAQTSALESGKYVYDVNLTLPGGATKTRVVEGIATVNPSVSRA